jgi:hypothetical protein
VVLGFKGFGGGCRAMGFAALVMGKDFGGAPSDVGRIAVKFLLKKTKTNIYIYIYFGLMIHK